MDWTFIKASTASLNSINNDVDLITFEDSVSSQEGLDDIDEDKIPHNAMVDGNKLNLLSVDENNIGSYYCRVTDKNQQKMAIGQLYGLGKW